MNSVTAGFAESLEHNFLKHPSVQGVKGVALSIRQILGKMIPVEIYSRPFDRLTNYPGKLNQTEYSKYLKSTNAYSDFMNFVFKKHGGKIFENKNPEERVAAKTKLHIGFLKARSAAKMSSLRASGDFEFAHYIRATCEYIQADPNPSITVILTLLGHDLPENNPKILRENINRRFGVVAGNRINTQFTPQITFAKYLEIHSSKFDISPYEYAKWQRLSSIDESRRAFEENHDGFLKAKKAYKHQDLLQITNSHDPESVIAKAWDRISNLRDIDVKIGLNGAEKIKNACQTTIDVLVPAIKNHSTIAYIVLVDELHSVNKAYRLGLNFGEHSTIGTHFNTAKATIAKGKNGSIHYEKHPIANVRRPRLFVR